MAASGAHTGDISAEMLKDAGCAYVIVGHSERRSDHGETDAMVRAKAEAVRAAGLVPIVCVGETASERMAEETLNVIERQVDGSLPREGEPGAHRRQTLLVRLVRRTDRLYGIHETVVRASRREL